MARVCMVTGKGTATGNNVAHCNKKQRRTFKVNLQWKRLWLESEKRYVRVRVSTHGLRIMEKRGVEACIAELRQLGEVK